MKKIQINAPANSLESAIMAIDSGANEIFCGVSLKNIKHVTFNGRPSYASLDDFRQMKQATNYAHAHGARVNFLLNLPFMADVLEPMAKSHIKQAVNADVDNFVVADLGLILLLEKMKVKEPIHIGSFATVRNNETIKFYSQFNVKRVIAPPDTTLSELKELSSNKFGIEVEAFVHGQGCSNVNGNCYLSHSYKKQSEEFNDDPLWRTDNDKSLVAIGIRNPCMFKYNVKNVNTGIELKNNCLNSFPFCSFCSLKELMETGITTLKIEGRCQPIEYQERVPKEYRILLDYLENNDEAGYKTYLNDLISNSKELQIICEQQKCFYKRM